MKTLIRSACVAVAVALSGGAALAQEVIPLGTLSGYLNEIRTAEGSFTQVNSDGSVSTGTIYLHRPGRVRFEYDSDDTLVMAGGGMIAIFDGRGNSMPEQYPIRETPLSLILARNVDFARSNMVLAHLATDTTTSVVAQDPDRPEAGTIELVFTANPVELRQWVITDQGGTQTTVVLGGLETGGTIPARLFSIPQEAEARGF